MTKLILCGALFAAALLADDNPDETLMISNGRWWAAQTEGIRLGWLMGYSDSSIWLTGPRQDPERWPVGAKNGEVMKLIDEFYADAANARIPLSNAIEWTGAKIRGVSAAKLTKQVETWRETSAQVSDLTTEQVVDFYDYLLKEKAKKQ